MPNIFFSTRGNSQSRPPSGIHMQNTNRLAWRALLCPDWMELRFSPFISKQSFSLVEVLPHDLSKLNSLCFIICMLTRLSAAEMSNIKQLRFCFHCILVAAFYFFSVYDLVSFDRLAFIPTRHGSVLDMDYSPTGEMLACSSHCVNVVGENYVPTGKKADHSAAVNAVKFAQRENEVGAAADQDSSTLHLSFAYLYFVLLLLRKLTTRTMPFHSFSWRATTLFKRLEEWPFRNCVTVRWCIGNLSVNSV